MSAEISGGNRPSPSVLPWDGVIKLKSRDPADRGLSEEIRAPVGFRKSQGEEIKGKSKHLLWAVVGQNRFDHSEDIFLCWRRFLL